MSEKKTEVEPARATVHCPKCIQEIPAKLEQCPYCGANLKSAGKLRTRPTTVTILVILEIISAIFALLDSGILIVEIVTFGARLGIWEELFYLSLVPWVGIMVLLGIMSLVLAYGYWNARGWAWTLGLIFAIINIILGLVFVTIDPKAIGSIILDALIIYYLTRSHVKEFFGKGVAPPAQPYVPAEPERAPVPSPPAATPKPTRLPKIHCVYCGAENPPHAIFCLKCGKKMVKPT